VIRRSAPDLVSGDSLGIDAAVRVIRAGGVVAVPTDTVYALAVDPRSAEAVGRLFAAKGRSKGDVTPLIAADTEQVAKVAVLSAVARQLARRFWPGGLTVILEAAVELPRGVVNERGGVGMRVPGHEVPRLIARRLGFPITASSANPTGRAPALNAEDAAESLPGIDLVLDGGPTPLAVASTVIDVSTNPPVLIREGAVRKVDLEHVLGATLLPADSRQ